MVKKIAKSLVEYVHDRAGDGLRTVVVLIDDDFEVYYLREDLKQSYSKEAYAEVVDTFRFDDPLMSPGIENRPVGERRAVVHYHQDACVIQLPVSESETILISLSREVSRDLIAFIESCREIVNEEE